MNKYKITEDAIDIINRYEAEIERLNERERILIYHVAVERERAIKEFAEKLKDSPLRFRVEYTQYFDKPPITKMVLFIDDNDIDNLLKEMIKEKK